MKRFVIFLFVWGYVGCFYLEAAKFSFDDYKLLEHGGIRIREIKGLKPKVKSPINVSAIYKNNKGEQWPVYRQQDLAELHQNLIQYDSHKVKVSIYKMNQLMDDEGSFDEQKIEEAHSTVGGVLDAERKEQLIYELTRIKYVKKEAAENRFSSYNGDWSLEWEQKWLKQHISSQLIRHKAPFNVSNANIRYYRPKDDKNHHIFGITLANKKNYALSFECRNSSFDFKEQLRGCKGLIYYMRPDNRQAKSQTIKSKFTDRTDRSPAYNAKLREIILSIQGQEDWWYFESDNIIVKSNLSKVEGQWLKKKVLPHVVILHKEIQKLIPPTKGFDPVSVLTVFADRKGYIEYVGRKYDFSKGLWIPYREELVATTSTHNGTKKSDAKQEVSQTILHESFHQYLYYATGKNSYSPSWFNEGTAEVIEHSEISLTKKSLKITDQNDFYEDRMTAFVKKSQQNINLRKLFYLSQKQFYGENMFDNYLISGALVYYILKAKKYYKSKNYDQIYLRAAEYMRKNKYHDGYTKAVNDYSLKGVNIERLERDFIQFWSDNGKRYRRGVKNQKAIGFD